MREQSVAGFAHGAVALEPTVALDQMSRYMNHLHELRRINDGDDLSDAPGYSLQLVRIPVSVLPGNTTKEGYGAELSVIAKPHLHDDLLPVTFRGLVINDLVDQFSFPIAKFVDTPKANELLDAFQKQQAIKNQFPIEYAELVRVYPEITESTEALQKLIANPNHDAAQRREHLVNLSIMGGNVLYQLQMMKQAALAAKVSTVLAKLKTAIDATDKDLEVAASKATDRSETIDTVYQYLQSTEAFAASRFANNTPKGSQDKEFEIQSYAEESGNAAAMAANDVIQDLKPLFDEVAGITSELAGILQLSSAVVPGLNLTPSRRSQLAFPTTQAFEVYGKEPLGWVALLARGLKVGEPNNKATLLLDMQKFLAEEFHSAYDFLNAHPHLWEHCSPQIHQAVRGRDQVVLESLRRQFIDACQTSPELIHIKARSPGPSSLSPRSSTSGSTRTSSTSPAPRTPTALNTNWQAYYGPEPPMEARMAFNDYVRCRWPVHVFAVDPITQDQNVADSFSQRREMQLALSLAFASGRIGSQSFTRMARRIELDMESIALHRTIVGFSHGEDTFGWRFYPRVQSPEIEGNIKTFGRMICAGGHTRDAALRDQRLEPGVRECTAIVLMPSFVPYVIFDIRSNWFRLARPANKTLDLFDSVDLSAEVTQLRSLQTACAADAHLYRQDEVYRLQRAVDQLERRLPLQTKYVQMPHENSLGGFEFFNSGIPDLAPELKGYYGEPGIVVDHGSTTRETTIFLVGDHFSVHETEVLVGNRKIPQDKFTMLSRQVMQVTVPSEVYVTGDTIDIHVATPYGVSNHIQVPKVDPPKAASETAIAAAITKHIESTHLDTFAWAEADGEIDAVVHLNADRTPASILLQGNGEIALTPRSPFTASSPEVFVEVRSWVHLKQKGQDPQRLKVSAQVQNPIPFDRGSPNDSSWKTINLGPAMSVALTSALQGASIPSDTEEIHLESFVRFMDVNPGHQPHGDARPVYRVDKVLKLKLKQCDPNCPRPTASSDCPSDQPAGGLAPASHDFLSTPPQQPQLPAAPAAMRLPAPATSAWSSVPPAYPSVGSRQPVGRASVDLLSPVR
ncbi:MAG: hypothetical protein R3B90_04715 [Planctomycetaceae bacterium]